jgi:hypothetical protein
MTTTQLISPPQSRRLRTSERRHHSGETVADVWPLIDAIPFHGPPLIFVLGPWLFLVLLLAPPFAVLVTFVVLMVVLTAVVALAVAILVAPFVLVRHLHRHLHLHRHRAATAPVSAPPAPLVGVEPQQVAARARPRAARVPAGALAVGAWPPN